MEATRQRSFANGAAKRPVRRPAWHQIVARKWQRFLAVVTVIAAAAVLRRWPLQALGSRLAWLTFYPAVMVAAVYGGLAAGLVATGLACLSVTFFWPALVAQPFIKDGADWLGLAVFVLTGTMISCVAEATLRANARARQAQAQLEEANKELESFSYSVSHDLRAPLRHVHGYVEMLQRATDGQLSDKAQRYMRTIVEASVEMGQLIDDLLAFSHMGRTELRESRVDMGGLVQDTIRDLETAVTGRNIVWQTAPLPPVVGDRSMLKQVLVNLLGNAVKYSRLRDPAHIEVGCAGEEDGRVILFVRDNGAGFDMQYVHKLFGVFHRLHRAEEFEGTGIGLATVRRIVARHGGRVWAEGAVNQGATFFFTLQRSPSE